MHYFEVEIEVLQERFCVVQHSMSFLGPEDLMTRQRRTENQQLAP